MTQDKPVLRDKSANASAGVYLQLISVIQSLALGLFVYRLDLQTIKSGDINYILQCLLILQVIVSTWHEYVLGTIIYDWPIGILDAWIPTGFGISQYYLITNLSRDPAQFPDFSWSLGGFAAIAFFAFLNQYFKSEKYEMNRAVIEHLKEYRSGTIKSTVLFLAIFVSFATLAQSPILADIYIRRFALGVLNASLLIHQGRSVFSRSLRTLFHEKGLLV